MTYDDLVRDAMSEVPRAVAAGLVDIRSGVMLSIRTIDSHPQTVLDLLAPATREMFEGDMVTTIEHLFKQARGVRNADHYFREILVSSLHLWHYFGRLDADPKVVLAVVCRGDANLGLLVVKARQIAGSVVD